MAGKGGPSEVNFDLQPRGDKVRLVVTHRNLASRAVEIDVATGWHTHLDVLIARLNGQEPRSFWTIFAEINPEYARRFAGD